MGNSLRTVGIAGIESAPWGTHFCHFYQTKEGLIDLLVPYFKAGLENNEFCLWVLSDSLDENGAREAMRKAVPQFDRYLQNGQMEIISHAEWYLKGGVFNLQLLIQEWIDKLNNRALPRGYDGMRATGDYIKIAKTSWKDFAQYEEALDKAIQKNKMLVLCTYALDKCVAPTVIEVVRTHAFAFVEYMGAWYRMQSKRLEDVSNKSAERSG